MRQGCGRMRSAPSTKAPIRTHRLAEGDPRHRPRTRLPLRHRRGHPGPPRSSIHLRRLVGEQVYLGTTDTSWGRTPRPPRLHSRGCRVPARRRQCGHHPTGPTCRHHRHLVGTSTPARAGRRQTGAERAHRRPLAPTHGHHLCGGGGHGDRWQAHHLPEDGRGHRRRGTRRAGWTARRCQTKKPASARGHWPADRPTPRPPIRRPRPWRISRAGTASRHPACGPRRRPPRTAELRPRAALSRRRGDLRGAGRDGDDGGRRPRPAGPALAPRRGGARGPHRRSPRVARRRARLGPGTRRVGGDVLRRRLARGARRRRPRSREPVASRHCDRVTPDGRRATLAHAACAPPTRSGRASTASSAETLVEVDEPLRRRLAWRLHDRHRRGGRTNRRGAGLVAPRHRWAAAGQVPSRPAVVARPSDTGEVAAVLALCDEARVPVTAAGGRSGVCGGSIPLFGGVGVSTSATSPASARSTTTRSSPTSGRASGPDVEAGLRAP